MADTTTLSRKQRERLQRREAMLEAARAVFAEKGFRDATLEEIAARAEFGKGTLYNYFEGGKEAILFSILDDIFDDLNATAQAIFLEATGHESFRSKLREYIRSLLDYFLTNRDVFAILIKEAQRLALSDESGKQSYFRAQEERLADILVPTIERAIADGEMKPLPARAMAHMIQGNVNGFLMFVFCTPECGGSVDRFSPESSADFLTTVLYDGMGAHDGRQELTNITN